MKLYMKQQPLSFSDRFYIHDEADREILSVEGELFTLGKRLHVYNPKGRELATVYQQEPSLRHKYFIEIGGKPIGCLVRRFALVGTRFEIDGLDWFVEGSFGSHTFSVSDEFKTIMAVKKALFSWGDSYELDIDASNDALAAVCTMLAIDMAIADGA